MTIQYINTGTAPNQGNGDSLRLAFTKINNNFSLLADNTFAYDAVGEVLDHPELQRGISVTYNPEDQAASFLVNIAGPDTLGAVRIGGGITLNPDTGLISVFDGNYNNLTNIPQSLGTTASPTFADLQVTGSLDIAGETTIINDTVIETANLTITLAKDATGDSSANTAGIIVNGPATPASLRYAASDDSWNFNKRVNIPTLYVNGQFFSPGNLGDITVDLNVISTANQDQDIVLNPDGNGRVRFPSTPIQFDNGGGGTYRDHLIYTAPDSGKVGLGVGESNNSLRIVGDGVTPGIVADFGTYANGTGTWASTVTVNSDGSIRAKGTIYQGTAYDNIEYTDTSIRVDADVNSFAQMIMQNHNTGTTASTDLVIMNDLGNDFDHIIDLGINSSNYNTALYSVTGPNDGYLFVSGGDLVIGTQSPGQKLVFHVDGTTINDAGGYLDTNGWTFNRSTNVLVSAPLPVGFRVQNTSNNVEAKATLQVANNTGAHLQIGINSDNPGITYGRIGPNDSFIHNHETTSTLHIGGSGDLAFYSNEATEYYGTPTLVMSRVDQSSSFAGHVLPNSDLTYDLGSLNKQWRSLYVGTSTIYIGGVPISINTASNTLVIGTSTNTTATGATNLATENFVIDYVTQSSSGTAVDQNVWVQTFETQEGAPDDIPILANSVEYDSEGNVIALFVHSAAGGSYYSVGKFTSTGVKIWTARFADSFDTDGWGLAVDNDSNSIYVAGQSEAEGGQNNATLTKIDGSDGSIVWSKVYDFGFDSDSPVVDVASDGNPVMVGYADGPNDDAFIITTKINYETGNVIWSRSLDGQGDEKAYGMAVGPSGEVVAVGYVDQLTTVLESYLVTPQTGSGMEVLVINRSDLSNDTFTTSWKVAGTGISEYADVTFINSYSGLTSTVREGSGAIFDITADGSGSYTIDVVDGGTNYLPGHKIKILGSALGGEDVTNDLIIEVNATSEGSILTVTPTGASVGLTVYTSVSGTNYQTGSGLVINLALDSGDTYTEHPYAFQNAGANYVNGDVVVIPGTQLGGTSPANDLTATVSVTDGGAVTTFNTFSGTQQTTTYRILVSESNVDFGGTGTWTLNDVTVDQDDRMLVVKYNSAGAIQWQNAILFDTGFNCYGADADIDSDGNIYVTGNYIYYDSDNDTNTSALSILKLDSTGAKQWSRRVIGNCDTFGTSIVVGPDDKLYLSGVTGNNNNSDYTWVAAKYGFDGDVEWQRLIDNTDTWTFGGFFFFEAGSGSNIAVKQDYVVLGGGFGFLPSDAPNAAVVQVSATGDIFSVGDWDFKAATFSGLLNDTASDITVVNAGKTDTDNSENITTTTAELDTEVSGFLIGTLYRASGGNERLVNGANELVLGVNGTLTLPSGGTISEGIVTSNPTIQLTPANPDVASQKLVIKGGGGQYYNLENGIDLGTNNNVWAVSDSATFYVYAPTRPNETLYWWIVPEEGGISTTMSGTVELGSEGEGVFNFTVISDAYEFRVRVSPTEDTYDPESIGVESVLINGDAPAYGDYHLHLTTGDLSETSIFLGTDDHNVRTTTDGKIQITTPSQVNNVWEFGTDGDLTLPAGGNILDSNGVNQTAQRVEGNWTVTTGTNTYNFTVPMDGTYVMWVKGNIPNGIITWNATVSVSNSNVPAIGTQYAWNYTGGGSPILLTAMPDQIRGTAGTISTDATYVGTTSNRFDFTIANTSGESQTVYYGYTKV